MIMKFLIQWEWRSRVWSCGQTIRRGLRANFTGGCLLALACVLLLSGCKSIQNHSLTYRLWDDGVGRRYNDPAPNPQLSLYASPTNGDILVQYYASSENSSGLVRRSYYLNVNARRVASGKQPEWVKPPLRGDLRPIPVLLAVAGSTNPPPPPRPYATVMEEGRSFVVHNSSGTSNSFELPVYLEQSGIGSQIALTPFAVAGDTLMVGGLVAFATFLFWLHCGSPTLWK